MLVNPFKIQTTTQPFCYQNLDFVLGSVDLVAKDGLNSGAPQVDGQFQIALKCSLDVFYFVVNYKASDLGGGAAKPNDDFIGLLG